MKRVAIVGAGAAGLAAAWCLGRRAGQFDVVVFEKSARVGGNALAVEVPLEDGRVGHVDIGVLFFNRHCPHWRAMIETYGIRHEAMQGTLAVEIGDLRWAHGALDGMGAKNLRESARFERWLARCDAVNRLFERIGLASFNPLNVVSIDALLGLLRFSRDFRVQVLRPNLEFLAVNSASIYGCRSPCSRTSRSDSTRSASWRRSTCCSFPAARASTTRTWCPTSGPGCCSSVPRLACAAPSAASP
jgi:predicted NAD/FAD-binding protein